MLAEIGVKPSFVTLPEDINPWEYVWSENAERRHLESGTLGVIKWRQIEESEAWEQKQEALKKEANRKRSEAMEGRPYASKGGTRDGESRASNDASPSKFQCPSCGIGYESPPGHICKYARDRRTDAQVAQAAGISEATAARAKAVVDKRPDLADRVQSGEITLNEASRLMKKAEVAIKRGELPEGKFRILLPQDRCRGSVLSLNSTALF